MQLEFVQKLWTNPPHSTKSTFTMGSLMMAHDQDPPFEHPV